MKQMKIQSARFVVCHVKTVKRSLAENLQYVMGEQMKPNVVLLLPIADSA